MYAFTFIMQHACAWNFDVESGITSTHVLLCSTHAHTYKVNGGCGNIETWTMGVSISWEWSAVCRQCYVQPRSLCQCLSARISDEQVVLLDPLRLRQKQPALSYQLVSVNYNQLHGHESH